MMLKSIELRWFFKGVIPKNVTKFCNLSFKCKIEYRTDYYLELKNCNNLGIKLRDKRLEIKWRQNRYDIIKLFNQNISGNIESWVRWEWVDGTSYNDIIKFMDIHTDSPLIKVDKKRSQKKFIVKDSILEEIHCDQRDFDCALEVTELKINDQIWWSVGFDIFKGEDKTLFEVMIKDHSIQDLLLKFEVENSYGYPEWISKNLDI
ncbi:MAG TPA: hypothetical protein VIY08_07075 [Candidatus Nitrosocosmicus sp.]